MICSRKSTATTNSRLLSLVTIYLLYAAAAAVFWTTDAFLVSPTPASFTTKDSRIVHCKNIPSFHAGAGDSCFTLLRALLEDNGAEEEEDDDDYDSSSSSSMFSMASLQQRIQQVSEHEQKLPLVVLDAMLPRQTLNITVRNELLKALVVTRLQQETPTLGMLGTAKVAPEGRTTTLTSGVQVEMVGTPTLVVVEDGNATTTTTNAHEKKALQVSLRGTRRFRVQEETVEKTPQGWTEARVTFLNSTNDDTTTTSSSSSSSITSSNDNGDSMSLARAMQMAREFTNHPNSPANNESTHNNSTGDGGLVHTWIALAKQNHETYPGQIDDLLERLGPIPEWKQQPSECAFWVGALINPIPALGVALEIRPQLLLAKTAEDRTQIAMDVLWDSIQRMQAMAKTSSSSSSSSSS